MVEITKKGQLPAERSYQATCKSCGTEFEFKRGEAQFYSSPRGQMEGPYLAIRCPLGGCGNDVWVSV